MTIYLMRNRVSLWEGREMDEVVMTKEKALENEEFRELYNTPTDCAGKMFDPKDIDCVGSDEEDPCRFLEECRAVCVADSTSPEKTEGEESRQNGEIDGASDPQVPTEEAEPFGVPQMIHLVEKAADVIGWTPKIKETAVRVNVHFEEANQDLVICQPDAIKLLVPYQWKNESKSIEQWMKETYLDRAEEAELCHGGVKINIKEIPSTHPEQTLLEYLYNHLSTVNLFLDEYRNTHSSEDEDKSSEEPTVLDTPDARTEDLPSDQVGLSGAEVVSALHDMEQACRGLADSFAKLIGALGVEWWQRS